jgi:hypothetical protein
VSPEAQEFFFCIVAIVWALVGGWMLWSLAEWWERRKRRRGY